MSQDVERRTPMQIVEAQLRGDAFLQQVKLALPDGMTPEKFARVAITALKQNPEIITGDPDTLFASLLRSAADGLLPDGREAALVLFNRKGGGKTVQYLPMIGGLRKVAAEDGFHIDAHVVHEHDQFDYELGERPRVTHKPPPLGQPRGKLIGAYATARDATGRLYGPEVMDAEQIQQVQSVSRAKDGDLWSKWTAEAWRKTVARRLFKQLPRGIASSERVDRVLHAADEEFDFPAARPALSEAEANIEATARGLPIPSGEQQLRDEPVTRLSDAQLNRLAALVDQVGEQAALVSLRGVFDADTVEDLSPDDAEKFEAMLQRALDAAEAEGTEASAASNDPADGGDGYERYADEARKA